MKLIDGTEKMKLTVMVYKNDVELFKKVCKEERTTPSIKVSQFIHECIKGKTEE